MAWTWRYEKADGTEVRVDVADATATYPTQSEAETWIGEAWRDLLSAGADQVTLLDGDQVVYSMGLSPDS